MRVKRLVRLSLLTAMGAVLHAIEALLPGFGLPGAKLGLANIVSLATVSREGLTAGLGVSLARVILGGLISGTLLSVSFWMSLAGAIVSTLVMGFMQRFLARAISIVGRSIAGAAAHNLAQVAVAWVVLRHAGVAAYLPYLLAFAIPTGYFVGLATAFLLPYLDSGLALGSKRA